MRSPEDWDVDYCNEKEDRACFEMNVTKMQMMAWKLLKVSLIYHGLLQRVQAFMIKAMAHFSKQPHSMWFEHTVGVEMYWSWFIKQCKNF